MFKIVPKETGFFTLFEKDVDNLVKASELFKDYIEDFTNLSEKAKTIHEVENAGDKITHDILDKLNKTFITPIDREDIHAIASAMDNILDGIDATADIMDLYNVKQPTESIKELVVILVKAIAELKKAVYGLRTMKHSAVKPYCVEINSLENEGDQIYRNAIAALFKNGNDPLDVIKWKEVIEHIEQVIDLCEDVADVIEGVVIKHA